MKKTHFFLIALLFAQFPMSGQECFNECPDGCLNAGFESGLTTGYCTYTGTIDSLGNVVIDKLELDSNRFAIMHIDDLNDTIVAQFCDTSLQVVPEGWGEYALRLGNAKATAKAERIVLKFTVTPELTFFLLNYAVVLNDPAHEEFEQPRFEMNILDTNDKIVDCGSYEVRAAESIPGFKSCEGGWRVRHWTAIGFELQSFLGEEIQIEILTTDCSQGAHAGYAYIDASYRPLEIVLEGYCPDSTTAQIRVTEGFIKYEWEADSTNTSNILNLVNPEPESVYSVTVTSGTGCTLVLSDTIPPLEEFPAPVFNPITTIQSCPGDSVLIQPIGLHLGEIAILNDNYFDTSFVVAPYETTEYIFVGYSKHRCKTDTLRVIVEVEQAMRTSFITVSDSFCSGDAVEFAYNSTGFSEHSLWVLGDGRTYSGQTPPPTIYYADTLVEIDITLIDSNACEVDSFSKKITILPLPDAAINIPLAVCVEESFLIAPTQKKDLTYEWLFGDEKPSNKREIEYAYKEAGMDTIRLSVTDNVSTCKNASHKVLTINPIPLSEIEVAIIDTCPPAKLKLKKLPRPTSKDTYQWQIDGQLFSTSIDTTSIFEKEGNFLIQLTTGNELGCSSTVDKNITIPSNPTATILNVEETGCINTDLQLESASEETTITYKWIFSNGRTAEGPNPIVQFQEASSIEAALIVWNGMCYDTATTSIEIAMPSQISIDISSESQTIKQGEEIELSVAYLGDHPTFEWQLNDNPRWIGGPTILDTPLGYTIYSVFLKEENDCVASDSIHIQVLRDKNIYIPNSFSPNDDGLNDLFFPLWSSPSIERIKVFRIYDRWGSLCFERENFRTSDAASEYRWDGTFKGKKVKKGVYVYYLVIEFKDGDVLLKEGDVTLVR